MNYYDFIEERQGVWRAYAEVIKNATRLLEAVSVVNIKEGSPLLTDLKPELIMRHDMLFERPPQHELNPDLILAELKKYSDSQVTYAKEIHDALSARLKKLERLVIEPEAVPVEA